MRPLRFAPGTRSGAGAHTTARASLSAFARAWSTTDLLMLVAVAIWGVNFSAIKLALSEFSPLAFNGVRFALATAVMTAVLALQQRREPASRGWRIARRDWPRVILIGLGGHTFYQLLFITGIDRTTPANSSLLMATSPIWVALIGFVLRVERIRRLAWTGILVSFVGIFILITGGGGRISLGGPTIVGDLLLLASAVGWAGYTVASKPLLARYSPLVLTTWSMVAGGIPLVLVCTPSLLQQDWAGLSAGSWGGLLFSALLSLVVCYLIWYSSVQKIGSARTAVYSNLIPVFAILFAWVALGDVLAPLQALGGAIVLAGLVITRAGRAAKG